MSALAVNSTLSPRTPQLPRAFTFGEFTGGAVRAWAWFQPFSLCVSLVMATAQGGTAAVVFAAVIAFYSLAAGIAATLIGSPLAYLLGFLLRRQRHDVVHVIAFAGYGFLVGDVTTAAAERFSSGAWASGLIYAVPASAAVALGWWKASRAALRTDREAATAPAEDLADEGTAS